MECFFEQWLKGSPGVRLQQLAAVLQKYQTFPQLYIYSESDHVVPHTSVEAFMEVQFAANTFLNKTSAVDTTMTACGHVGGLHVSYPKMNGKQSCACLRLSMHCLVRRAGG